MNNIIKAWQDFSAKVENRLKSKCDAGYKGWDREYSIVSLREELTNDAILIEREPMNIVSSQRCIDIAARAMMIERRTR